MRSQAPLQFALLVAFAAVVLIAPPVFALPSLELVTPLDRTRAMFGLGLSADGTTVAGFRPRQDPVTFAIDNRAFVWTRSEGFRLFDELGPGAPSGATFAPYDVSGDGSRIVGEIDGFAAVWERGGATTLLGLLPGGSAGGTALAISDDGRYAVGTAHDGGVVQTVSQLPGGGLFVTESPRRVPVRWQLDDGTATALTTTRGSAFDVSNEGIAVGELLLDLPGVTSATAGFRWDPVRGRQDVPSPDPAWTLPYAFGGASGISADGTTLVGDLIGPPPAGSGSTSQTTRAYLWSGEPGEGASLPRDGLTLIDSPPSLIPRAEATAVSADGSTIVGNYLREDSFAVRRPFIWTRDGGFQDLTVLLATLGLTNEAWDLFGAIDVSADGKTILGTGRTRPGFGLSSDFVWIAVIPEPSTAVLLGAGLSILASTAGRRARIAERRPRDPSGLRRRLLRPPPHGHRDAL